MACELQEAYEKCQRLLPDEWTVAKMEQGPDGWHVTAGKWTRDPDNKWWPRLDAMSGSLTKALNRLADRLEQHGKPQG